MTPEEWDRLLPLLERAFKLIEKWIDQKYPPQQETTSDIWKKGEAPEEPQTPEEYRDFPSNAPGRFQRHIEAARRANSDS